MEDEYENIIGSEMKDLLEARNNLKNLLGSGEILDLDQ
jgi:hypothetical protein